MEANLKAAKDAINKLYSDTSVSLEETLEALQELKDEIDLLMDTIKSDIENDL